MSPGASLWKRNIGYLHRAGISRRVDHEALVLAPSIRLIREPSSLNTCTISQPIFRLFDVTFVLIKNEKKNSVDIFIWKKREFLRHAIRLQFSGDVSTTFIQNPERITCLWNRNT